MWPSVFQLGLVASVVLLQFCVSCGSLLGSPGQYNTTAGPSQDPTLSLIQSLSANLSMELSSLKQALNQERALRTALQKQVESKTDEIYFLKRDMSLLNKTVMTASGSTGKTVTNSQLQQLNRTITAVDGHRAEEFDNLRLALRANMSRFTDVLGHLNMTLQKQVSRMESEGNQLNQSIQRMEKQHTNDFRSLQANASRDLGSLQTSLQSLQTNMSTLSPGNHPHPPRVVFTATNALSSAYSNESLIFQTATPNVGSFYDTRTGIFTCPVAGFYFFISHLAAVGDFLECALIKNGVVRALTAGVAVPRTNGILSDAAGSSSVFLHLDKGDTVKVGMCTGRPFFLPTCSFSGALMFAD